MFRSIVDRARSPLARQWSAALADTLLADSADFLRGIQPPAGKEKEQE